MAAVKLAPMALVSGKLLDAEGEPLAGAEVSVSARTHTARDLYRFAQPSGKPVVTDKDGRFTLPGIRRLSFVYCRASGFPLQP